MSRYIDVNKVKLKGIAVFDENLDALIPLSEVRKALELTPTADVVEVRHGEWRGKDWAGVSIRGYMACSCCNVMIPSDKDPIYYCLPQLNYCPRCGAKMDRERKENGA